MKARNLVLAVVAIALLAILIGCGGGDNQDTAATPPKADTATEVAQTHDCDGGCGMTNVPMDHLTEIDGKFYCQGCANKVKAATEAETTESPDEHNHG